MPMDQEHPEQRNDDVNGQEERPEDEGRILTVPQDTASIIEIIRESLGNVIALESEKLIKAGEADGLTFLGLVQKAENAILDRQFPDWENMQTDGGGCLVEEIEQDGEDFFDINALPFRTETIESEEGESTPPDSL